jgi:hypothetical protein
MVTPKHPASFQKKSLILPDFYWGCGVAEVGMMALE